MSSQDFVFARVRRENHRQLHLTLKLGERLQPIRVEEHRNPLSFNQFDHFFDKFSGFLVQPQAWTHSDGGGLLQIWTKSGNITWIKVITLKLDCNKIR